uniref:Msx2-interacting protein n=1 Tax=Astyanax mexicanus TaxID=7994 RepID=A0A8B9LRU5_ASTMX
MGDRDLRTDYNEPGTIPTAARGLDDSLSIATRARDVSGFTRGAGAPVYGTPASLHSREGRYERRLDGASESRDRAYDHSAYGHHERGSSSSSSFERQRHYDTDYYRDPRDRALSGGVSFYGSRSRSPSRFETTDTRYEARAREAFTLASVVHRDLYREERSRRGDRTYRHSRSRSPHASQTHNVSPQRLASQAARPPHSPSGSGSRSRSSSSDSVSSTSSSSSGSDSSSSSSDESPARSVQSAAVPAPSSQPLPPLDKDETRKSFGIKVQNLPVRSTDTSLKDGLFHEFKKHGKVTSVQIHGASEERYGLVFFRQQEDQEKALSASKGKLFFGMQIDVTAWTGPETESENEFRPLDERIDEFHPKATRTLFIGNLEKTTTYHDLLNIFQRFGEIVDIDIKKLNGAPQYAFLQYCDIASVCKAIKKMDGEYLGNNRLKLGFGKSMPTTCVWLDGLASNITEQYLTRHFCRYGHVVKVVFDRLKGMALVLYNNIECAQAAVKETKGWKIGGNKIKVDFANHESQMAFYRSMQASGQDIRDFYDILSERRDDLRPPYHEFSTERAYYENVRTPGTYTAEDPRRKYPARSREFYTEWDPYTTDYYDPRYYDEAREYRDYRDPYEQDIRKYSYMQRERDRDRERFDTDRERDHGRRTIEHPSQSPSHPRRPASPVGSPSLSERLPSDTEHHIYSRSSERSGSCSSISPPRFEKPERISLDRYNKSAKLEKERPVFEAERGGNSGEKDRRAGRKEKGDKDRSEKQKLRKLKLTSPSVPSSETEPEPEREASPETAQRKSSKPVLKEKDSGKGRLDLPPCVVQLTRVKEKEGKLMDHTVIEKLKGKTGSLDPVKSPPPLHSADHKNMSLRIETQTREILKHGKVLKEKCLASQVEVVDREGKSKSRQYLKADPAFDNSSMDTDRLAARKRRFEEATAKANRLKRMTQDEDEGGFCLKKLSESHLSKGIDGDRKLSQSDIKRESKSAKTEKLSAVNTIGEGPEISKIPSLDLQSRPVERTGEASHPSNSYDQRMQDLGTKSRSCHKTAVSDGNTEMEHSRGQYLRQSHLEGLSVLHDKDALDSEERLLFDMDHSQSCRKQMEKSRRLQQQLQEPDKTDKTESTPSTDAEDFDRRSLVHEVGKPPQDVTDDSPPLKRKKSEAFDYDFSISKERKYRSSRQLNDEPERRFTTALADEQSSADILHLISDKDKKESPKTENKIISHLDGLKYPEDIHVTDAVFFKVKKSLFGDEELCWERKMRQETLKAEMNFPSSIVKCDSIRKRLVRELEPGEVQSDSDDDGGDLRHLSPKLETVFKREREGRLLDLKLSGSLEKTKFYEFALDKTITPDTKALLERAKSLSSSRDDNWSFLGYDSRFTSIRTSTDKEKVEPTPRPIPSWYMKKKKIRSDSEGKHDDKKEDPKHEEQERQELFASRFLHSSIFEQDSRRLRHLERKDENPEVAVDKDVVKSSVTVEKAGAGGADISQEPVVLFRNRFLELQQKKDKDQEPHTFEKGSITETVEKNVSSTVPPPLNEKLENIQETRETVSPNQPSLLISIKSLTIPLSMPPTPTKDSTESESNKEVSEPQGTAANILAKEQNLDVKPPTPAASPSKIEPESLPKPESLSPKIEEQDIPKPEFSEDKTEEVEDNVNSTVESSSEKQLPVSEPEVEPTQPTRKQPKSKKAKANQAAVLLTPQSQAANSEKPAIRKSERIDREKLKKALSPRGEAIKVLSDSKNTSKSPVNATDMEQTSDSNVPHGRTRQRRNVRSVYATPPEDEAHQQPGKEVAESSRSMRKRATDKEPVQQEVLPAPVITRRGRPPKIRKRADDVSPMKGWRSPRSQKAQSVVSRAGQSRRAAKADKQSDSVKGKVQRLTRSTKISSDDKVVNLKNLVINLSGDPIIDALHSGDENSEHILKSLKKTEETEIPVKEESQKISNYFREVDDLSPDEKDDPLSDSEPSEAALLARQMELERAVENISKLATEQPPTPYKEAPSQTSPVLPPVEAEPEDETEVEKPANPASETELAAAIDSITAEDISGDADGFQAPPTYTALLPTSEPLALSTGNEVMGPETDLAITNIMDSEPCASLTPESRSSEPMNVIESPSSEIPKKGGRARPKTPKKSKGRKVSANKRTDVAAAAVFEAEPTSIKLPESIPEDIQTVNPKAATSSAVATVVTVAAACKHEVPSTVTLDTPKEAEQPAIDQPEPQESAFHSGSNSPSYFRSPEPSSEPVAPALTPPSTRISVTPTRSAKVPLTAPDWRNRTDEKGVLAAPQVTVATTTPTVGVGGPLANPPIPPDTKASDIDPSSSTLRKILMEPKYVSASNSNAVSSTVLTTTLADPRMSQNENSPVVKSSLPEDRPSPITPVTPQMVTPQPPPQQSEPLHIFKEKIANSVISSTATSVISRIPMPFDFDDTPRISLSNRNSALSQSKQKYRVGVNENSRYHGHSVPDEGRLASENTPSNTDTGPGLRVNTSEGVMVLSYSGQKTGGPHRVVAKISQIPPPSAVDIEFQQSVSKSQMKQESIPAQPSTPKGSQTPTGLTSAVLSSQGFNAQPVISSLKQDIPGSDKSKSVYHTGVQGAHVKTFQQSNTSPILRYSQSILHHTKKAPVGESVSLKVNVTDVKQPQTFGQSSVLSPHPSLAGNHLSSPGTPNDRLICHSKQEPHSPRTSGNSTSPFSKVCPTSTSVVLGTSGPLPQYVTNIHHPEQSVIMPPHNVTQSVPISHITQGNVRMNTPPLSGMNYGMRADSLSSPRPGSQQRPTTPQPAVIRDMLLKSHAGPPGSGQVSGASDDEVRLYHQGARRPSVPQLQSDVMVIQPEYKGIHHSGLPSSKTSPVVKNSPQALRDASKAMEVKMPHSPHSESRIIGHSSGSVITPQGVQLIHPGNSSSIPEYYREMRGFRSQLPSHSVIGINMANRSITPSQVRKSVCYNIVKYTVQPKLLTTSVSLHVYYPYYPTFNFFSMVSTLQDQPKVSHITSAGPLGEPKLDIAHVRHPGSMDLSHVSRIQSETPSPSYTSPTAITPKSDLSPSLQKGFQSIVSGQLSLPSSASAQIRPDIKLDHAGHPSVDMVQLLKKYPIVWQGHLALKNDSAAVQLHFVSGNNVLAHRSLPPPEGGPPLRIAQRMRLEASQLEGVARRMTVESDYCLLLALPCGLDQEDVFNQTHALKTGFITYLQAKQAAGIINVPNPGSNQPAYVVQIFPPCEFSESHLSHLAPDLLNSISSISPHLMIVIASV